MGFFDSLFGGSTKTAVTKAAGANATGIDQATQVSGQGKQEALGYNQQGLNLSLPALQGGYDQARGDINSGIQTAHQALNAGGTNARNDISSGFANARGVTENAMQRIAGYYDPYMEGGKQGQKRLGTLLGYDGVDAAKTAASDFAGNDPGIAYRMDMLKKRNDASANQSGFIGSGRAQLADSRAQSEMLSTDYQKYLDRLAGQAQMGQQSAGQLGQFQMQGAGQIGQAYSQEAAANSANEQRHAESLKNLYTGNAIGSGQLATGQGRDIANLYQGYATNNQNIATGNTSQQAQLALAGGQNLANMYMGQAAADQQGMNNMLKIAGLGIGGLTPGSNGTSAFGSAAGALKGMMPSYGDGNDPYGTYYA